MGHNGVSVPVIYVVLVQEQAYYSKEIYWLECVYKCCRSTTCRLYHRLLSFVCLYSSFILLKMTQKLMIASVLVTVTMASFIPPYYGSGHHHDHDHGGHHRGFYDEHERDHDLYDKHYGDYDAEHGGHEEGHLHEKYGHDDGHKGHHESAYDDHGHSEGGSYYDKDAASGHKQESYEDGAKHASDVDGIKKFSYFAAGSGPEGEYQKGYYGSVGYEDSKHDSKYTAGGSGSGFKKGHDDHGSEHHDDHSDHEKAAAARSGYGDHYKSGHYGKMKEGHGSMNQHNGWKNSGYESEHGSHGSH
uniref:Histidine-rich glycoprotein-like n=1 Tax=Haemonchus contortus TaxID=6289 RepID=A0A7I4YYP9_HAECO